MTINFPSTLTPDGDEYFAPDATAPEDRTQYGAVCWRRLGARVEVLLITSRDTGRWVIPKGWPIVGLTPEESAAREAFEEAGVEGRVSPTCMGLYSYEKGLDTPTGPRVFVPCVVAVYPMQVKGLRDQFPEVNERRRKWFSPKKAARKVAEPALQDLLEGFEDYLASAKTSLVGPKKVLAAKKENALGKDAQKAEATRKPADPIKIRPSTKA